MTPARDPYSVSDKAPRLDKRVPLVVVGAGPAGIAAAIEATRLGVEVMLIDENPVDMDMMAMDVPLYFGQRMSPTVRNRAAMMGRIAQSNPGLGEADEAGADVQLGVCVWGAYRNGPTVRELDGPLLGLADEKKSWLVGYDRLIVAAGARDLGMGFPGWERAGTMGANAAISLMTRYGALAARRMIVVGSGALGLHTAALAIEHGVEIAGVVEVLPEVRGDEAAHRRLADKGVTFYRAHTIREARGRTGEVESVVLVRVDADLMPVPGTEIEIACDTICLALGLVPNVELLDVLGCRLPFRSELGGFVPDTDEWMRTSVADVFAVGDCAGVQGRTLTDDAGSRIQGRLAGLAAAVSLGAVPPSRPAALRRQLAPRPDVAALEVHGYWRSWLRSLLNAGGWDVKACQCEEVPRRDLVDVQPPRYLNWETPQMRARSLGSLLDDGPLNQDQIKRLTRAGMGPCQGRRCREQVALLLAEEAKIPVDQIPLPSYRSPVRPLPLNVLWPHDEPRAMREHWVGWFGIQTQFAPQWRATVDAREGTAFVGLGAETPAVLDADPSAEATEP